QIHLLLPLLPAPSGSAQRPKPPCEPDRRDPGSMQSANPETGAPTTRAARAGFPESFRRWQPATRADSHQIGSPSRADRAVDCTNQAANHSATIAAALLSDRSPDVRADTWRLLARRSATPLSESGDRTRPCPAIQTHPDRFRSPLPGVAATPTQPAAI